MIFTLALANLHTFDLLLRGNIDGMVALGVGLGWLGVVRKRPWLLGCGLWLLAVKPINILLALAVLIRAVWHWSPRDKLVSVSPLAVTVALSFPVFGFDWPLRYVKAISENPPGIYLQTSLWRILDLFGFEQKLAWWLFLTVVIIFCLGVSAVKNINPITLALALAVNMVFSPYTLGSHYILLAPAFVALAQESNWFIAIWFLTLTPLVRLMGGFEVAWLDILYPVALMFGAGWIILRRYKQAGQENHRDD